MFLEVLLRYTKGTDKETCVCNILSDMSNYWQQLLTRKEKKSFSVLLGSTREILNSHRCSRGMHSDLRHVECDTNFFYPEKLLSRLLLKSYRGAHSGTKLTCSDAVNLMKRR